MHRVWIEYKDKVSVILLCTFAISERTGPVHFIVEEAEKVLPLEFFREKVGIACQYSLARIVP